MSKTDPQEFCLQNLKSGIALADPESWRVLFENARFVEWFPPGSDNEASLDKRVAGFDAGRAGERLKRGRPFTFDTEVTAGGRKLSVAVELRREAFNGADAIVVECQNVTKQKEAEYMLDTYSQMAERNARELQREKERVERLLLNIMPRSVYEEMKDLGTATPQRFDSASVLMLDFVGFTDMAVSRDPSALIGELNDIFSAFDRIVEMYGCERIKTIGDGYLAVSGIPEMNAEHALNIAKVALRMRRYLERRNASHPTQWLCRIGISTGPIIGSLVGVQKYVYDVFGPAVNMAARLEQICEPMQISVTAETLKLLRDDFTARERGTFEIKGFGPHEVYSLDGEVAAPRRS